MAVLSCLSCLSFYLTESRYSGNMTNKNWNIHFILIINMFLEVISPPLYHMVHLTYTMLRTTLNRLNEKYVVVLFSFFTCETTKVSAKWMLLLIKTTRGMFTIPIISKSCCMGKFLIQPLLMIFSIPDFANPLI